jgi:hypothetical protein
LLGDTGAVGEAAADNNSSTLFSYNSKKLEFCSRWVFYIIFDSKKKW